ncbi:VOC family protein [Paenibacillus tarimensis]|uniref:VOC family protein n=1 Tax=Paenibacillus tarimensis TaxID=416012 RepID=UPI001F48FF8F|nr:VOC family protein [Paenibacillus tarimensis]MCF2946048.1 VOC family protein [Paenibacillus tarimensis]
MIHHVEINVSNLESSIEFWEWLLTELGYSEYQRWPKGVSWKFGEAYIVFVQADQSYLDVPYHRKRVGLNHIAFHASTRDQLDKLYTNLVSRGVRILYKDKHPYAGGPDYYALYFEDPDRIKVEIVAPLQEKSGGVIEWLL